MPARAPDPINFDLLFEHNPLPMWIFDLETLAFLAVNRAAIARYGYSRQEFLAMSIRDIRPAQDVAVFDAWREQQKNDLARPGRWRHQTKAGEIFEVEVRPQAIEWQGRRAVFTALKDLSEQDLHHAEIRALWQKHIQLEEIVNRGHSIAFVWRNEPGWPVDFVSDNISQLGFAPEEFAAKNIQYEKLILAEDLAEARQHLEQAAQQRQGQIRREYRLRDKTGQIHWVEDNAWLTYDRKGYPLTFSGIVTDISERKQAEQKLIFQAALAENISDAIIATDTQFNITHWNRAAEETYGWQAVEVLGKRWGPLAQTEYFGETEEDAKAGLAQNGFWSGICSQSRKDGGRFFVESRVTVLREAGGKIFAAVAVNRDITERVLAEQRLHASEQRFRLIFEQTSAGVARISLTGQFVEINRRFCEMLGYSREEMLTKTFQDITHPEDLEKDLGQMRRLLAGEIENYLLEKRYLRQDRQVCWASLSVQLVRDLDGQPDYFVSVVQDITERKLREREIDTIYQSGRQFDSLHTPREIAQKLIEILATRLGWNYAGVWLRRAESDQLQLLAFSQPGARDLRPALRRSAKLIHRVGDGLTGWVIANGQSVLSGALQDDPRFLNVFSGMNSGLYVPLQMDGKTVGCVSVENAAANAFDENHQRLLETLAGRAAVAIANAQLLQAARQRAAQLETLVQAGRELSGSLEEVDLLKMILQAAQRAIPAAEKGSILLLDESGKFLLAGAYSGYTDEIPLRRGLPRGKGYAWRVIEEAVPLLVEDIEKIPSKDFFHDIPEARALKSSIAAPLLANGRAIGALCLDNASSTNAFSQDDLQLLAAFAGSAAISLEKARLFGQIRRRAEQLTRINAISRSLAETLQESEIYRQLAQIALDIFPGSSTVYISRYHRETQMIEAVCGLQDGLPIDTAALPLMPLAPPGGGIQSEAIHTGRPFIAASLSAILRKRKTPVVKVGTAGPDTRSGMAVPMMAHGDVMGVLQLQSYQKNHYTASDGELLSLVANTAAVAVENARLFAQTQKRLEQLSALRVIDNAISSSTSMNVTLTVLLEYVRSQLRVDAADILLLDGKTLTLEYADGAGFNTAAIRRSSLRLGEGLAGRAVAQAQRMVFPDLSLAAGAFARQELQHAESFQAYACVPLVTKGEVRGLLEIFHRSKLKIDDDWTDFLEMLAGQAAIAVENTRLFDGLQRSNQELVVAYDVTIEGWSQALELRDEDTEGHSRRVTDLALELARELGVRGEQLTHMRRGGLLHDIGKLGIPDNILHKPGPLTPEEWAQMRQHPVLARELLSKIPYLAPAIDIPYCHHEKWDGSGYPRGLKGEQIPLAARIFAISDVFDALTSDRVYRKALTRAEALEYIRAQAGSHFAPRAVEVFLRLMKQKPQ